MFANIQALPRISDSFFPMSEHSKRKTLTYTKYAISVTLFVFLVESLLIVPVPTTHHSLLLQGAWLAKHGFGGYMFWASDLDDFNGTHCGQGKYPLHRAIVRGMKYGRGTPVPTTTTTTTTIATTTTTSEQQMDAFEYEDENQKERKHFSLGQKRLKPGTSRRPGRNREYDYREPKEQPFQPGYQPDGRFKGPYGNTHSPQQTVPTETTLTPDGVDYVDPEFESPQVDPGPYKQPKGPHGIPDRPSMQPDMTPSLGRPRRPSSNINIEHK